MTKDLKTTLGSRAEKKELGRYDEPIKVMAAFFFNKAGAIDFGLAKHIW